MSSSFYNSQVPASERLDFMRKFSLYPFSMKLGVATDLWSEVAVLVMVRQEILKLLAVFKVTNQNLPALYCLITAKDKVLFMCIGILH